jgi:hypothetical protein
MIDLREIVIVSLLGLLTTSSSMVGAALGLYVPLSKRVLACVLAFAAGALISALAIELAFEGAQELHRQGFNANASTAFIGCGFALGSVIHYFTSLFLDQKGAGDLWLFCRPSRAFCSHCGLPWVSRSSDPRFELVRPEPSRRAPWTWWWL